MEFEKFSKIPRLRRGMIVTEKIDGTNAQIVVRSLDGADSIDQDFDVVAYNSALEADMAVRVGSRNRWITPGDDNFGFARWVCGNADQLATLLGEGRHFGEWWGSGIQRTYGLDHKKFSLFNTSRWLDGDPLLHTPIEPLGKAQASGLDVDVVPVLSFRDWSDNAIEGSLNLLRERGSVAAPGFMQPEGIVVFHVASRTLFKQTIEADASPKSVAA